MSDELDNKIKQISEIFGQQGNEENIKKIMSMLANNMNEPPREEEPSNHKMNVEHKAPPMGLDQNIEMVRKAKTILDRVNSNRDSRITLLNAIKPFLNNSRQGKCSTCINILQLSNMAKIFSEMDFKK